jgi:hypothetical protein
MMMSVLKWAMDSIKKPDRMNPPKLWEFGKNMKMYLELLYVFIWGLTCKINIFVFLKYG